MSENKKIFNEYWPAIIIIWIIAFVFGAYIRTIQAIQTQKNNKQQTVTQEQSAHIEQMKTKLNDVKKGAIIELKNGNIFAVTNSSSENRNFYNIMVKDPRFVSIYSYPLFVRETLVSDVKEIYNPGDPGFTEKVLKFYKQSINIE